MANSSREPKEPRPGPSREPEANFEEVLQELTVLFPQVCPDFLKEKVCQLGGDRAKLEVFVAENLEDKVNLPSRRDWEEKEVRNEKEAELKKLKPSDFLSSRVK